MTYEWRVRREPSFVIEKGKKTQPERQKELDSLPDEVFDLFQER